MSPKGHWRGFGQQWSVYLPKHLTPILKRIWRKELPKASGKSWKTKLIRKIVLEWLEWKGYLKK